MNKALAEQFLTRYEEAATRREKALALYESEGFVEYGRNPKGFRSRFTGWQALVLMRREL